MRRLLTAAAGLVLCALANIAGAKAEITTTGGENRWYDFNDSRDLSPAYRHHTGRHGRHANRHRRHAGTRWHRRRIATRPHARRAAHPHRRHAVRHDRVRSSLFLRHAGGGASRACLTPAAQALLRRIEAQFGRVHVVSTCRPGARIAGTGRISRHASGNAIDFHAPPGRKGEVVRWLIANHRSGGIMTYAGMAHIHVDIGPRFVTLNHGARW
jgi:hypothetical protein